MKKIISLFKRDYEGTRQVYDEVVEGAGWVKMGQGVATEKIDGTACMVRDGKLFKRYDVKGEKATPPNFEPSQKPDDITGHWPGWVPVKEDNPQDKWHCKAPMAGLENGTYELIGPKVQGNSYNLTEQALVRHGQNILSDVPRDFNGLKLYFEGNPKFEGIVWHHPDGRMVKIKRRDFGFRW